MAYTDFPNVIRSPIWDSEKSGVVVYSLSDPLDPLPPWDGERYAYPDRTPFSILFVATGLFDTEDLYIDSTPQYQDQVGVSLYGSDGELMVNPDNPMQSASLYPYGYWEDDPNTTPIAQDPETLQWRRVARVMWLDHGVYPPAASPVVLTGVKSILITNHGGGPQGRPTALYGIYGIKPSADVPFWTGFEGDRTSNGGSGPVWPYLGKRLTELF